jgi:hypothetical protein
MKKNLAFYFAIAVTALATLTAGGECYFFLSGEP